MSGRILHLLSQRPSRTGSGVTLDALVRLAGRNRWRQQAVVGVPVTESQPVLGELEPGSIQPVFFRAQAAGDHPADLDFPVPGMSDVMPYESSVWSTLTEAQLESYRQTWTDHLRQVVADFRPDLIQTNHIWLMSSLVKDIAPDLPVVAACHATGLRQMILGSKIAPYIDGVWGCEFVENPPPPGFLEKTFKPQQPKAKILSQIAYALDNTTKTRAVFEINKGTNKIPGIDVNAKIPDEDRRVPFQNMIYVADGPSDIPVFSIINQFGGRTFAVYQHGSKEEFAQVNNFQKQGRVQSYGEANYTEGSQTAMWIKNAITEIADLIVKNREQALGDKIGKPPKHLD